MMSSSPDFSSRNKGGSPLQSQAVSGEAPSASAVTEAGQASEHVTTLPAMDETQNLLEHVGQPIDVDSFPLSQLGQFPSLAESGLPAPASPPVLGQGPGTGTRHLAPQRLGSQHRIQSWDRPRDDA